MLFILPMRPLSVKSPDKQLCIHFPPCLGLVCSINYSNSNNNSKEFPSVNRMPVKETE